MLVACWLASTPPGAAPDELEHYTKAVATAQGDLYGLPADRPAFPATNPTEGRLMLRQTRLMRVPRDLVAPPSWRCIVADHKASAACTVMPQAAVGRQVVLTTSYVGNYIPVLYALPGLLASQAADPYSASRLGRLAMAVFATSLLVIAVLALWSPRRPGSLTGLVVATSPMVVFNAAVLSPSAVEIAASIAVFALVIRLARGRPWPPWVLVALAVSGWLVAVARPLGPFFLMAAGALLVSLVGLATLRDAWREQARRLGALIAVLASGCAVNFAWDLFVVRLPPAPPTSALTLLPAAIRFMPEVLGETIGVFGPLDTLMPRPAYALGGLIFVLLLAAALLAGPRSSVRRLEVWLLVDVVGVLMISMFVVLPLGVDPQGRYVLPLLVSLPLVAGEMVATRGRYVRQLSVAIALGAGLLQATAWYSASHRFAVGLSGPWWFLAQPQWQPPGAWLPWLLVVALASVTLVIAGVAQSREGRSGSATL